MTSVQAWRLLRTPFSMPERCLGAHECEWERIDVDKSGCRLCSHVHVCGYGRCTRVTETCDALVCEISGLCVRTSNISDTGFSDEVISYGSKTAYSGDARDIYDDIEVHVHELLLSDTAREVVALERGHHATKIGHAVQRACSRADVLSVVDAVEHALRTVNERKRYDPFDAAARSRVAALCCQQLRCAIPICSKHLNLGVRRSDMRVVVFGLLYLMRSGVTIHDICVLPCIDELCQMLPNESNLLKYYAFRSKHITGAFCACRLRLPRYACRANTCRAHTCCMCRHREPLQVPLATRVACTHAHDGLPPGAVTLGCTGCDTVCRERERRDLLIPRRSQRHGVRILRVCIYRACPEQACAHGRCLFFASLLPSASLHVTGFEFLSPSRTNQYLARTYLELECKHDVGGHTGCSRTQFDEIAVLYHVSGYCWTPSFQYRSRHAVVFTDEKTIRGQ